MGNAYELRFYALEEEAVCVQRPRMTMAFENLGLTRLSFHVPGLRTYCSEFGVDTLNEWVDLRGINTIVIRWKDKVASASLLKKRGTVGTNR